MSLVSDEKRLNRAWSWTSTERVTAASVVGRISRTSGQNSSEFGSGNMLGHSGASDANQGGPFHQRVTLLSSQAPVPAVFCKPATWFRIPPPLNLRDPIDHKCVEIRRRVVQPAASDGEIRPEP